MSYTGRVLLSTVLMAVVLRLVGQPWPDWIVGNLEGVKWC